MNTNRTKGGIYPEPGGDKPVTKEELFDAIGVSDSKAGPGTDYGWPWKGWAGAEDGGPAWKQARERLNFFEKNTKHKVEWVPLNGTVNNDGPASLNSDPGRAFIERITNCIDARIEYKLLGYVGQTPASPREAVEVLFGVKPEDFVKNKTDEEIKAIALESVVVRHYAPSNPDDTKDNVIDARDYGIGLTAAEMPNTILSLARGLKKFKPYLTGKHGWGATSTLQFADLTVVASRKHDTDKLAYTVIEQTWEEGSKTPTYRYLTIDGKIPEIDISNSQVARAYGFERHGTLVRHIGYNMKLPNHFGENSVAGLLARSMATALLPVAYEHYFMRYGEKSNGLKGDKHRVLKTSPGRRTYRSVRGAVTTLERASWETNNVPQERRPNEHNAVLHRYSEAYLLGEYDYGGREGKGALGHVVFEWWALEPRDPTKPQDAIRAFAHPMRTVLFTLDGQTHAEESRSYVTAAPNQGAGLWAIGQTLIVHVNCDGLDPRAKYALFTSTREHLKENPIKRMILDELVHRLKRDPVLKELNVKRAAPTHTDESLDDDFSQLVQQYLKTAGVNLDVLRRVVREKRYIEVEHDVPTGGPSEGTDGPGGGSKETPPPIEAKEDPTFLRWKLGVRRVKMYPGQRYSWMFETDAPVGFWDGVNPTKGKIQLLDSPTLRYRGAAPWDGGRVRCRFQCPDDANIGDTGLVQIQVRKRNGQMLVDTFEVAVIERPKDKDHHPGGTNNDGDGDGEGNNSGGCGGSGGPSEGTDGPSKRREKVEKGTHKVTKTIPLLRPVPIMKERDASVWGALAWDSPTEASMAMHDAEDGIRLYYNAEYPLLLNLQKKWESKGLAKKFTDTYALKLALHGIFSIDHKFTDEQAIGPDARVNVRRILAATNDDLLHAASKEVELELQAAKDEAAGK